MVIIFLVDIVNINLTLLFKRDYLICVESDSIVINPITESRRILNGQNT